MLTEQSKNIIASRMIDELKIEWDFDTYVDAMNAVEDSEREDVTEFANELIEHFFPTNDMGEFFERQAELKNFLINL